MPWFLKQFFSFSAKLGQFNVPNNSLQTLQRFAIVQGFYIEHILLISKFLQTLQRFAGGGTVG